MKLNIFKNTSLNESLGGSPYISTKNGDKKKKMKKNSYTDKFIDKKKLYVELATTEKIKNQKKNITSSKKEKKQINNKFNLNSINKSEKTKNNHIINKQILNNTKITKQKILNKNYSHQNFNIKYQFLPKNKQKFLLSEDLSLNKENIKRENNTNNLNSNIILINNNNINYTNKNENIGDVKDRQNINIILNNKIHNINKIEESKAKEKKSRYPKEPSSIKNIIIDNNKQILTNEDIFQNEKVKSLLITNISDITNNISNIYSNTEQSVNSNIKNNIAQKISKNNSNNKINEYCFKNKSPINIINNIPNDNTYSKERMITNYNNDFEINISDIKRYEVKNNNSENHYFFKNTIDNEIKDENVENEGNANTIIKKLKIIRKIKLMKKRIWII